ncbi:hypothetical protein [Nostoc sp.]
MNVFASKNSDVYTGYAYAYVSQGMTTYEFDRHYIANIAKYRCLHSVA